MKSFDQKSSCIGETPGDRPSWAQRRWSALAPKSSAPPPSAFKIVTYNILEDGETRALSTKHSYCPLELRLWESGGKVKTGRFDRLIQEILSYDASFVALQELRRPYHIKYFQSALGKRKYRGIHGTYDFIHRGKTHHDVDAAVDIGFFYKEDTWNLVTSRTMFAYEFLSPKLTSKTRKKMLHKDTVIQICLLEKKNVDPSDAGGQRHVIVAMTHLYYHPSKPNQKLLQAECCCTAINEFRNEHSTRLGDIPVVFCGDFNSTPVSEKCWLPEASWRWVPKTYPNGVYSLLKQGEVCSQHPEHPDSFGERRAYVAVENEVKKKGKHCYGNIQSKIALQSVYDLTLSKDMVTTKTDDFSGRIDYIFYSDGLRASKCLEMPFREECQPEAFEAIPSAHWPSDHLAIGAELFFEKTMA